MVVAVVNEDDNDDDDRSKKRNNNARHYEDDGNLVKTKQNYLLGKYEYQMRPFPLWRERKFSRF